MTSLYYKDDLIEFDSDKWEFKVNGDTVHLQAKAAKALGFFLEKPGILRTSTDLARYLYGPTHILSSARWYIYRLREEGIPIKTIHKLGYRYDPMGTHIRAKTVGSIPQSSAQEPSKTYASVQTGGCGMVIRTIPSLNKKFYLSIILHDATGPVRLLGETLSLAEIFRVLFQYSGEIKFKTISLPMKEVKWDWDQDKVDVIVLYPFEDHS